MANTHFGVTAFLRSAGKEEATNSAGERLDCRRFFAIVRHGRQREAEVAFFYCVQDLLSFGNDCINAALNDAHCNKCLLPMPAFAREGTLSNPLPRESASPSALIPDFPTQRRRPTRFASESFGRLNSVTPQFALSLFHPDKERKLGDSGDGRTGPKTVFSLLPSFPTPSSNGPRFLQASAYAYDGDAIPQGWLPRLVQSNCSIKAPCIVAANS